MRMVKMIVALVAAAALAACSTVALAAYVGDDINPLLVRAELMLPWDEVKPGPAQAWVAESTGALDAAEAEYVRLRVELALCTALADVRPGKLVSCGER